MQPKHEFRHWSYNTGLVIGIQVRMRVMKDWRRFSSPAEFAKRASEKSATISSVT